MSSESKNAQAALYLCKWGAFMAEELGLWKPVKAVSVVKELLLKQIDNSPKSTVKERE